MKKDNILILNNSYWEILKSLSNEVKLRLATRLTASVIETKSRTPNHTEEMLAKYAGAWQDNRSTEEIIKNLNDSRHGSKAPLTL